MKLKSLSMNNFMPFRGEQRIDFPNDSNRNVMIVFGDNMRGKTSLLNALRWGFYGTAMGRHLRPIALHQLHNIDAGLANDWKMEVSITFETIDGDQYELRRQAIKKRLVAKPTRPEDFEVQVYLKRNGAPLLANQIEQEINKFAPEQVSRFFLFDGELLQEYETLLIEGSDQGGKIKESIEQCLGVPALINGRIESAALLKKAQKKQIDDNRHLSGAERILQEQRNLQDQQDSFENDLIALKDKLKKTKDERAVLDDDLEKSDSIHQAKLALDEKKKRRDEIIKEQEKLHSDKLECVSRAWRDLIKPKLIVRYDQLIEEQQRLTTQIGRKSSIETEIRQIESLLKMSVCPTCGQQVGEDRRKEAGAQLGSLQVELRGLAENQDALISASAEIAKLRRLIEPGVGEQVRDKDRQLDRLEVELTKVENTIDELQDQIKGYDTAEIARKRTIRDALIKEEGVIESSIERAQRSLDKVKQDIAILSRRLDNLPAARAKRSSALVSIFDRLELIFSESIERLRDSLRNRVEAQASDAFKAMITQKAYSGLQINNNYGLTILDEHSRPVPVRSSGAEQIVALSLIDGLSRSGRASGPVVMDTPFGRLDLNHRDNILRYLPKAASQLVLLVHNGEIRDNSDLAPIASRIWDTYQIREVGPRHSIIERSLG